MGYKRDSGFKLKFEDGQFDGLEVVARSLSIKDFMALSELVQQTETGKDDEMDLESSLKMFEMFASRLVSWNLEDDEGPVPATLDGIMAQDLDFILQLILAWMNSIANVSSNLGKTSNPGQNMEPLPMETL